MSTVAAKSIGRALAWVLVGLAAGACSQQEVQVKRPDLQNGDQKALYALGAATGRDLVVMELTPDELGYFLAGLQDQFARSAEINLADLEEHENIRRFQDERGQLVMDKYRKDSQEFLSRAGKEPGAQRTESGIVYRVVTAGEGVSPGPGDIVRVHFKGTLSDGTEFDSSTKRPEPTELELGSRVIPCWQDMLPRIKPGGKIVFVCPPEQAYDNFPPPGIPAGAALQFEIELVSVVKAPTPPAPPSAEPTPTTP